MTHSRFGAIGCTLALAVLAGCGGGGGDSPGAKTGTLRLGLTDAPVDQADAVVVQFTGVELKPKDGVAFSRDFATPKTIDVLALQGTTRAMLLDGETVPAGEYEWMRLKVNADPAQRDSYVTIRGEECEMRIPSGAETGLKLVRGFTVGVGTTTDFTIDFDLRKSVVQPPGQRADATSCNGQMYMLKPALRLVDNLQVGTITGTVDSNLVAATSCVASAAKPGNVYLFGPYASTDPVPVPDDVDGNAADGADPVTTAQVSPDTFRYTIGFVPAGRYVVAYTCDADDSTIDADVAPTPPATGETVNFTPTSGTSVDVAASQTVTVDFAAPPPG
ncbi:MAG: DUF4382 domain-containing protein [Gammaproteobacteria bacterium]|nr:DUF4382 domain-containing protein [Gammaproteobacteria bacterium]